MSVAAIPVIDTPFSFSKILEKGQLRKVRLIGVGASGHAVQCPKNRTWIILSGQLDHKTGQSSELYMYAPNGLGAADAAKQVLNRITIDTAVADGKYPLYNGTGQSTSIPMIVPSESYIEFWGLNGSSLQLLILEG